MAECRECGATIRFVTVRGTGKVMPIDPIPVAGGNVAAYDAGGGRWHGWVITAQTTPEQLAGHRRYLPHFATCRSRATTTARVTATPPQQEGLFDA